MLTSFVGSAETAEVYPPYSLATHPLRTLDAVLNDQASFDDEPGFPGSRPLGDNMATPRSGSPVL